MPTKTDTRPSKVWEEPNAVQIRVALDDIEPPIWRRLAVPLTTTLSGLHHILQAAMGWTDSHLHRFEIGGLCYGDLDMLNQDRFAGDPRAFDASEVRLRDFRFRYGAGPVLVAKHHLTFWIWPALLLLAATRR